ncbi:MAG TPA: hypothetical protein VD884_09015 [Ohtaekwangia sp.]|nr:hypothetical protein [Ohtaekwangia sp.]
MAYTVFFKEGEQIFTADNFIHAQPIAHQSLLKSMVQELALQGTISHQQATRNSQGHWSVVLTDNGDVYIYTLYVSQLEKSEVNNQVSAETPEKQGLLVIIDPSGPRDSIGGYHPGYWSVEQYATFLEENQRNIFMHTLHQILHNIPSENYTRNNDRSVSIHIRKEEKTFTISLACRAQWI